MMPYTSKSTWETFKILFKKNLENSSVEERQKLQSYNQRKYLFKNYLFSKIADDMQLVYEETKEFLKVDYTFFKKGQKHEWQVPIIFIESENSWDSSYEEILKLSSLNSPLKILILYGLSDDSQKAIDEKEHNWDYIFEDFLNEHLLIGYFAIIIYTSDSQNNIVFKTIVYDQTGQIIEKDEIKIESII